MLQVSCGARHTLLLSDSGSVFSQGWNKYGQLCLGSGQPDKVKTPQLVNPLVIKNEQCVTVHQCKHAAHSAHGQSVTGDAVLQQDQWQFSCSSHHLQESTEQSAQQHAVSITPSTRPFVVAIQAGWWHSVLLLREQPGLLRPVS